VASRPRRRTVRRSYKKRRGVRPNALVLSTKPLFYEYSHGLACYSNAGKKTVYFLHYDTVGLISTTFLGDGTAGNKAPDGGIDTPDMIYRMDGIGAFSTVMANAVQLGSSQNIFWLSPRKYQWEMVNQQTHPIEVDIYWMKFKHDMVYSTQAYATIANTWVANDCNDLLARCMATDNQIGYAGSALTVTDTAWTPERCPTLMSVFKIVRHQNYELKAGQCLRLKHTQKNWWKIDDYVERSFKGILGFGGRTIYPLIMQRGCNVTDTAVTAYSRTDVGGSKLTWRFSMTCKVYMENITKQLFISQYMNAPPGAVTGASTVYMSNPVAANVAEIL